MICPLCTAITIDKIYQDKRREYFLCSTCNLISVPPGQCISSKDEKARYDKHQNNSENRGYYQFLYRIFQCIGARLSPGSNGLDFGCGPYPVLSEMFEKEGHHMSLYDYYYADDVSVFENHYDFITATEVVEHLHHPRKVLERLWSCLKPGGSFGIMTQLWTDCRGFAYWHYIHDITHICFFSRSTFEWLAALWQAELAFAEKDIILLCKKNT